MLDSFQIWQVENDAGTVNLAGEKFVKVVKESFFAPQVLRNIFNEERVVVLGMHCDF